VISNLLNDVMEVADQQGAVVNALQKAERDQRCDDQRVAATTKNEEVEQAVADGSVDVVAGMTWLFVRGPLQARLGALVVDEASQLSLANVVATATVARDLILVGDPQQLAQPSKGTHPLHAGVSALEHILDGHTTMPDDRGLFMERSRRLHPDVCSFVSELASRGGSIRRRFALTAASTTARSLTASGCAGCRCPTTATARHRPKRSTSSPNTMRHSLAGVLRPRRAPPPDRRRHPRRGAQVAQLVSELPEGGRVRTVDKFQGQQAPWS
jgi:uncharacterized protein